MNKDRLDHRPLQDGGDDLELPGAAVRAAMHVDIEHLLEQPRPPDSDWLQPFDDELGTAVVAPIAVIATLYTFTQLGCPIDCLPQAPATEIAASRRLKLTPLTSLDQLRRGPGPRWGVHLKSQV